MCRIIVRVLHIMLWAVLPLANTLAGDLALTLDGRFVASDARRSFLDGGLGKLRYGDDAVGVDLGRLRMAYRGTWGEITHVVVDASAWSTRDTNPIDLTEAYLEFRPVPRSTWRSRVKLGAFYPAISLEHRAAGWTNPYTLSSSALNTWIGEELRTIGVQYELAWAGSQQDRDLDLGVSVAVYGWNDPAGVVVGLRGFALHDRQTPLFGRVRTHVPAGPQSRVLFEEIDDRPGYYVSVQAKYAGRTELRALHYDNRADPAAFDAGIQDYAWETLFDSVGVRHDGANDWTFMAQWLGGSTYIGGGRHDAWDFSTAFALVAKQVGRHRLAVRAETFEMEQLRSVFTNNLGRDRGHAWTVGWTFQPREPLELSAEWLQVDSNFNWRTQLGEQPRASERALQLGVRYTFQ